MGLILKTITLRPYTYRQQPTEVLLWVYKLYNYISITYKIIGTQ